jgi:hypothetical protein
MAGERENKDGKLRESRERKQSVYNTEQLTEPITTTITTYLRYCRRDIREWLYVSSARFFAAFISHARISKAIRVGNNHTHEHKHED